ncbi:hypothetical protein NE235_02355 [Actinoallomurus spadix]|uniref:Uncharacterized protein n=1 Tax=Actinoallomurus spadix TaxID=79912 RepID=A0ABN0XJI8_9ACTN|nr:hypothetical protein [Actinoallomurus spadix]MCO5984944.1 hypothetical protein [Actinoallomurus spadix]
MLTYEVLAATDDPDQLLGVYSAEPGTPSAAAFRLLSAWTADARDVNVRG